MTNIILQLKELEVECEGIYYPSSPERFSTQHGNFLPGEPGELYGFKIFLVSRRKQDNYRSFEITHFIPQRDYDELYEEFCKQCRGDE